VADAQVQLVTVSEDESLHIVAWHLDEDQVAGLRETLGEPDHEAILPADTARAVHEAGRQGVVALGEHDHD
jgi:hypothetical protein